MNKQQKTQLTRSFNAFARLNKADFNITHDEWIAFWQKCPLMALRCANGADEVAVTREDQSKPWTIDNLSVSRRVKGKSGRLRAPAGPAPEPYDDVRRLTLKEWLDEVRQ